jgi:hypothetical protein
MNFILHFCQWLNDLAISTAIRESPVLFPVIETIHVIAITLLVGTAAIVDLRLLGLVLKKEKVTDVVGQIEPLAWWGFGVLFISGTLLFLSEAEKSFSNPAFRFKLFLLCLAGLNPLIFHLTVYRRVNDWDTASKAPWQARATAIASLTLWAAIIVSGRAIAYFN